MRLASRLLLAAFGIVSLLVLSVTVVVGVTVRQEVTEQTTRQLAREARLVSVQWSEASDADALADAAGVALGHRVTLIDSTGRVVGDSEFGPAELPLLENHGGRVEVQAARATGIGTARRRSPSAGDEELYVAVRAPRGIARVSLPTRSLESIFDDAQRRIYVAGGIALVLAMIAAFFFARAVSRPVTELRDVARGLAAGDLSRRPSLVAPGEVGDLAAALHRLAEQLEARLTALEEEESLLTQLLDSLNEGAVAIDARRQVVRINEVARLLLGVRQEPPFALDLLPRERSLRDAVEEALGGRTPVAAEGPIGDRIVAHTARPLAGGGAVLALYDLTPVRRLEAVRRDFVANVSHELKTPLTIVGGFAETLLDEELPAAQRARFAGTIVQNVHRMQRIVDDLLDLSRIESGGWRPAPARVDVRAVFGDCIGTAQAQADARGIALEADVHPDAAHVWADPTAVRQVIGNLTDNAVRHTSTGAVRLVARPGEEGGTWLEVSDTGVGIAAEHLPRIFERFYRVDPGRSREAGGTGLGLAIVRHLVESHGGRVQAESLLGRGTTIRAWFPPTPADAAEQLALLGG